MQLSVKTIVLRVAWKGRMLQRRLSFSGKKFIFLCLLTKEERGCLKVSLLRIQIKNQYKKTLSNPDNTNLLYSNSTNRKETPLCASTTASMTIEAAIALPLFVICILSVIFLFRVLELQQDVEYALQYAARKSAIHAHMTHESGQDAVVPIAEAKILFQRKIRRTESTGNLCGRGRKGVLFLAF